MPRYDVQCDKCKEVMEVICASEEIDSFGLNCPCGGVAKLAWLPKAYKPFPAFVTKNIDGKPQEITSLHQIRKLEKANEHKKLCWEPGSYNSKYGDL